MIRRFRVAGRKVEKIEADQSEKPSDRKRSDTTTFPQAKRQAESLMRRMLKEQVGSDSYPLIEFEEVVRPVKLCVFWIGDVISQNRAARKLLYIDAFSGEVVSERDRPLSFHAPESSLSR